MILLRLTNQKAKIFQLFLYTTYLHLKRFLFNSLTQWCVILIYMLKGVLYHSKKFHIIIYSEKNTAVMVTISLTKHPYFFLPNFAYYPQPCSFFPPKFVQNANMTIFNSHIPEVQLIQNPL